MIHIYWGMGKGKTSILNGSAIRAKGANLNVAVFRFLKGRPTSEDSQLKKLGIPIFNNRTSPKFTIQMTKEEKKISFQEIKELMDLLLKTSKKLDVILIDEFLDLASNNVKCITEKEIIEFLKKIPKDKEILISGHTKLSELFKMANLITKLEPIKHYFDEGVQARKGFEF